MCPECGAALAEDQSMWMCDGCGSELFRHHVDYGYHAPDVEAIREVVREIKMAVKEMGRDFHACAKARTLKPWADRLESALKGCE
jgi:predicted amidophosphoribosyltransferase